MKTLLMALATLAITATSVASENANYFRVWQGFKKTELTDQAFMNALPSFMTETVNLYSSNKILSNYIVVIPPKDKPSFVPDELALVTLSSEEKYKEIRKTEVGIKYTERHWDVFNKETSASAKQFIDYKVEVPKTLVNNAAYDIIGEKIDWSKGYIVTANENYEVAYLNWTSKAAHDEAGKNEDVQYMFQDANALMDLLMYVEAKPYSANEKVDYNTLYTTVY